MLQMTSYYNTEVKNHAIKIGDEKFIVHDKFLELLPSAVLHKKGKEYDLTKSLSASLTDALDIKYHEEFEVDPHTNSKLRKIILSQVVSSFKTILHFIYGLEDEGVLAYDFSYPDIFLDSLCWMIDYLGLGDTIYSLRRFREFLNDAKLFYGNDMFVEEQHVVATIIASFLKDENESKYIDTIDAIEMVIRESKNLHILATRLREEGYFYLSSLVDMKTVDVSADDNIFPSVFYNRRIKNYTIIPNYELIPVEDERDVFIIHSPFIGYNSLLIKNDSLKVNHSAYAVSLGLEFLYKFFLKDRSLLEKLMECIEELEIPHENLGDIYFFLKDIDIFGQYPEVIKAFILYFEEVHATESTKLKTRQELLHGRSISTVSKGTLAEFAEKTINPLRIGETTLIHAPYFSSILREQYRSAAAMYDSAVYNSILGGVVEPDEVERLLQHAKEKKAQNELIEEQRLDSKDPTISRDFRKLRGFFGNKHLAEFTEEEEEPRISRKESQRGERRGERGESLSRTSQRRSRSRSTSRSRPVLESKRIIKVGPLVQKSSSKSKPKIRKSRQQTLKREQSKIRESSLSKRKAPFSTKPVFEPLSGSEELEEELLLTTSGGSGSLSETTEETDD